MTNPKLKMYNNKSIKKERKRKENNNKNNK